MNKKLGIVIAVIVILALGYFAYTKMDKGATNDAAQNTATESGNSSEVENTNPEAGKKMAFDVFVKQGGSYVCTVHQSVNNVDSVGTVYVSNGQMRGDFDVSTQGTKMTSSMIMKDGFMYSWSSSAPTMGFKMAINNETAAASTGGTDVSAYGYNQFGDYDCDAWSGDSSKFNLPASVKFTEMKAQ